MFHFNLLLLCLIGASCALKVMNLNLVSHSDNGPYLRKIADKIKSVNPDILTLQRTNEWAPFSSLMKLLGEGWSGVKQCHNGVTGVYTRHEILGHSNHVSHGINLRIRLNESALEVSVWSMYLEYRNYGRYYMVHGHLPENVLKNFEIRRVHNIVELLKNHEFVQQIKNSDNIPVIVAGMFYGPSHLDWTEDTKGIHHGRVIEWPVTKLLSRAAGMTDSFRELYPDPEANPGNTFDFFSMEKTGNRHHSYVDRANFIFYRGSLRPKSSFTFNNTSPLRYFNDYYQLRDVATEFEYTPHKYENKPSFFIERTYSNVTFAEVADCPKKIIH